MGVGIYRKIYLFIVCLILVISSSTAESDLYDLIVSKMNIIEVNLAGIKEDTPYLYSLFENRNVSISTRTEGLPEMQLEATDFLLFDVEWTDGIKEEGIIQIPISINRNVFDGISYPLGNAFQWFGGLVTVAILFVSNFGSILVYIMNLFTILKGSLNF